MKRTLATFAAVYIFVSVSSASSVYLPGGSSTTKYSPVLEQDQWYLFETSGVWYYCLGTTVWADVEYTWNADGWHQPNPPSNKETLVNGQDINWLGTTDGVHFAPNMPSPSTVYRYYYLGEGAAVGFRLVDDMWWDNSGGINITITETTDPTVPEPATMLASLAGLAGIGRYLRQRVTR